MSQEKYVPNHFIDLSESESKTSTMNSKHLKLIYIVISSLFLVSIIVFITLIFVNDKIYGEYNFVVDYVPFQSHLISITIVNLLVALGALAGVSNLSFKHDKSFFINYNTLLGYTYIINTMFIIIPNILSFFKTESITVLIINLSCHSFSLGLLTTIYKRAKNKNYDNKSLVSISIYISLLFAKELYSWLFYIVLLISWGDEYKTTGFHSSISIAANSIYVLIGIGLLSAFKDIYFTSIILIIEVGLLSLAGYSSKSENISIIVIFSFTLISILITVVKYKKAAFGIDENDDIIQALEHHRNQNRD